MYIDLEDESVDPKEAPKVRKRASSYYVVEGKLYRRGFSMLLLKCLESVESEYVLAEIHEGVGG